jgi:aldehyde:ferredoxin oxidoreductase
MQPVIQVNLTTDSIEPYTIPPEWEQQYLGGASLAARLLYDHLVQDLDPLSPDAPLLFINGPLPHFGQRSAASCLRALSCNKFVG